MFRLSERSLKNLEGVKPDLVEVVKRAIEITAFDFWVFEGLRTQARQQDLVRIGKSKTLLSRHLTGHAVDLYPSPPTKGAEIPWYRCGEIGTAMFKAAEELGVNIRWGADWNGNGRSDDETFIDSPHFELRRQEYPD